MSKDYTDDSSLDSVLSEKSKKRSRILDQLEQIESESDDYNETATSGSAPMLSSFLDAVPKKKAKKKKKEEDDQDADEWFNNIMEQAILTKDERARYRGNNSGDLLEDMGFKKKKKKKKDKESKFTDYNKEFATEMALLKSLFKDQSEFTDALQKEYDDLKKTRSTARGYNKSLADLVNSITSARKLALDLVDKNISTKKLIKELTLKEKKELGNADDGDAENLGNFASSYLKEIIANRHTLSSDLIESAGEPIEFNDDIATQILSQNIGETDRSEDAQKYLKYENQNVSVQVVMNQNDFSDYEFIAKNENGEILEDYPLPFKSSMSVNTSTRICTDSLGKKYYINWK